MEGDTQREILHYPGQPSRSGPWTKRLLLNRLRHRGAARCWPRAYLLFPPPEDDRQEEEEEGKELSVQGKLAYNIQRQEDVRNPEYTSSAPRRR